MHYYASVFHFYSLIYFSYLSSTEWHFTRILAHAALISASLFSQKILSPTTIKTFISLIPYGRHLKYRIVDISVNT